MIGRPPEQISKVLAATGASRIDQQKAEEIDSLSG
jgi:hypothetical protein